MYEGLLVCILPAALLGWWLVSSRRDARRERLVSWAVPFAAVLLVGSLLTITYNHAVTGRWFSTPHGVFSRQYFGQGVFMFSTLGEPERRPIARLAALYDSERHQPFLGWRAIHNALVNAYVRLPATIESALGVVDGVEGSRSPYRALVLWIAAFMVISLHHKWARLGAATILVVVLGQSIVSLWFPHYSAPVVPLVIAVAALTFARQARGSPMARTWGPPVIVLLAAMYVSMPALWALARNLFGQPREASETSLETRALAGLTKTDVVLQLEAEPGSHLVFVSYDDDGPAGDGEWVYNAADLRTARIVFAHDLGAAKNAELIAAHPDRHTWRVSVTRLQRTHSLEPYPHS
jgi:hypothetical protein